MASASTAGQILAIPLDEPERLFSGPHEARREYLLLIKHWYPDINPAPEAKDVTAHLNRLWDTAEKRIKEGAWQTPNVLEVRGTDGKLRRIRYRRRRPIEVGELLYSQSIVAFVVKAEYADLFHTADKLMAFQPFADLNMANQFLRLLPIVKASFEAADQRFIVVLEKTPDVFLLDDVLAHLGGRVDPRHVAWIMNCLYNLACYLDWRKLTHNAITTETVFISPQHHSCLLLGGWWYATEVGSRLSALPSDVKAIAPPDIVRNKKADPRLDLALIRRIGRQLLGDVTGMSLAHDKDVPKPMADFLRMPAGVDAKRDYVLWSTKVLPACFGERRFVEMTVPESAIY